MVDGGYIEFSRRANSIGVRTGSNEKCANNDDRKNCSGKNDHLFQSSFGSFFVLNVSLFIHLVRQNQLLRYIRHKYKAAWAGSACILMVIATGSVKVMALDSPACHAPFRCYLEWFCSMARISRLPMPLSATILSICRARGLELPASQL